MINPRSLIRALDKHWEAIEQLVLFAKDQPAFARETLLSVLARVYVNETPEQRLERLQGLLNSELLTQMPRANAYQLHDDVRQFVGNLLNEHELGLSEVLKVRIGDIKSGLQNLHEAMQNGDMAALQHGVMRIDSQLRQITRQLDQDYHAILDIAERAKTADNRMPLARRYQEVLEAFDRYVEPMTELMDTGAGGSFYPLLEETERVLDALAEQLHTQGGLYSHQLTLRQVSFRVKDLRRTGREVLKQCTNTLMPLREEMRRHNQLSAAIGQLLGDVRKKGLRRTFAEFPLPLWRREQARKIYIGTELLTLMERARGYQPKMVSFPESDDTGGQSAYEWVDEELIRQNLYNDLPVSDLMAWLAEHYAQLQDVTLLRLYHRFIRLPELIADPAEQQTRIELQRVAIKLHSHQLTPLHDD